MAIMKDFTTNARYQNSSNPEDFIEKAVIYKNAYIKVLGVAGTKENLTATVGVFEAAEAVEPVLTSYQSFTPALGEGSDNFLKQSYNHLKTLSEFAGGEDC